MKNTHYLMAPLFAGVVVLLSVGAVGELIFSLFSKLKSTLSQHDTQNATTAEVATQLK